MDALALIAIGATLTLVFYDGRLDLAAARAFYNASTENHWPLGGVVPWSFLYRMAPWITASLILGGLAALAIGAVRKHNALQRHAMFLLLSVALGPGLLVNGIFKDHWERPRPRDIVEFSGDLPYAPAPLRGDGGKSFPCGHCSVGFLYALGWWVWRQRRPRLALASALVGAATGIALGIGRLAAGGHFLSDVAWSALIALGIAHVLYHYVLRIPEHEALDAAPGARLLGRHALALLAATGGLGVLAALFAAPHGTPLNTRIALASLPKPPQVFRLSAKSANVEIVLVDPGEAEIAIAGELHGFGLPGSRLQADTELSAQPEPSIHYRIEERGWITDLDAAVTVRIPVGAINRVVVHLEHGNIKVADTTKRHVVKAGDVRLDLHTAAGQVRVRDG